MSVEIYFNDETKQSINVERPIPHKKVILVTPGDEVSGIEGFMR